MFGIFNGIKRCAAGFQASNQVPLPRACPCSERACLKPSHLDCMGCCGSHRAHGSSYSTSDCPLAYTRAQDPQPARLARRAAATCDRVACLVSVGGSTGGRTFRGAISARVHPRRSPLALWPCPPHSAYDPVVSALFRRSLRDLGPRNDVIDAPAGTLSSAL